jgi:sugar phosphate permease
MLARSPGQRWVMLAVGLVSLITACAAQYGYAFLLPALRAEGFDIRLAAALITAPVLGVVAGLIAWGWAADRWGERVVLSIGLAAAGCTLLAAGQVGEGTLLLPLLFVVGATSSAVHAASGRLILGWFASRERGLAMGIRQTGQPLGVALAALALPALAADGIGGAFAFLAVGCLVSGVMVAALVRDPVRAGGQTDVAPPSGTPYRAAYLWRIHAASGLLIISQTAILAFAFDFLVTGRGWHETPAGLLVAFGQLTGASGRIAAGWWSDRLGTRLTPMRWLSIVIGSTMAVLGVLASIGSSMADVAILVAMIVTVSPNGLAFTAVAEYAGRAWAGRALGIQNTFQNLIGAAVPPTVAGILAISASAATGYGIAFGVAALFPFLAVGVIPAGQERDYQ